MCHDSAPRRHYAGVYSLALFAAWVLAWDVDLTLRARTGWTIPADTVYWIALKGLVWVLPVLLAIHWIERVPPAAFLGLRDAQRGLRWGFSLGAALVAVTLLARTLPSGAVFHLPALGLVFVNAVVVAPFVEELTLRGFLLKLLEMEGHSFWRANVLTTAVFVAMHLPGWFFQGREMTLLPFGLRAVPLAGLSLLLGWTRKRSGSLYAAIVLHAINNLYSAFVP